MAVANTAQQSLFSELYSIRRGLLQTLDMRVKLVTFLFILVLVSFLHDPRSLCILYAFSLALAAFSRVPLGFFLKRVWLFVPLFSAAIVLPATLNVVTPGDPVWVLFRMPGPWNWGPYSFPAEIAVTRQGLWGAVLLLSRVAVSVSFSVLLTLTSKWSEIFSGLRALFIPRIFVMTLSMTERYLFVFLRLIQDMYRARKSRTIHPFSPAAERSWTASRIGMTFKKCVDMSEDIHKAMLSRGFRGEFRFLDRYRLSLADAVWTGAVAGSGVVLVLIEKGIIGL